MTPARVAQAEGISERYLQKLFEGAGDNFSHYVRERRLQRALADLSNPAEASHSISEIAYRYGFADSAHFEKRRHRGFNWQCQDFANCVCQSQGLFNNKKGGDAEASPPC